jgi:acetolactate synthase II small subunit
MTHTLFLQAQSQPAVLERLLRVVRHRRYDLRSLDVHASADHENLDITLTVSSERPILQLRNQLCKLNDVLRVEVERMPALRETGVTA